MALLPGSTNYGLPKRMLGTGFNRCCRQQNFFFIKILYRYHIRQCRFAFGNRSGLVQYHHLDVFQSLYSFTGTDQHSPFGPHARSHHNSCRCGQAQGTGTGDNQHRNCCQYGRHPGSQPRIHPGQKGFTPYQNRTQFFSKEQPHNRRRNGDYNHSRHEFRGQLVGKFLNWHLGPLSFLNQFDHLGKKGIGSDTSCFDLQQTFLVDGGAYDLITGLLFYRHRFTSGDRFIQVACAFHDLTIRRHLFSRSHHHDVAYY